MRIITNDRGELQLTLRGVVVETENGDQIECSLPLLRRGNEVFGSGYKLVVPLPEEDTEGVLVEVRDFNSEPLFTVQGTIKRNAETGNELIVFELEALFDQQIVCLVPVPFEPEEGEEAVETIPCYAKPSGISRSDRERSVRRAVSSGYKRLNRGEGQ